MSNQHIKLPILAVGPLISSETQQVSGQAMLFQALVDMLSERGMHICKYDISEKEGNPAREVGAFTIFRVIEYLRLLPGLWLAMVFHRSLIYLTTAQSLVGFLRDAAIIWPAFFLHCIIITHQFGGNYAGFYRSLNWLMRWFIRITLSRVDAIIVEGDPHRRHYFFLNGWEQKVFAVPNGLPERNVEFPDSPKYYDPEKPFVLFYLSNMFETKGCWDVLEAVRLLAKERGRNVQCSFAGKWLVASDSKRWKDPDKARKAFFEFIEKHDLQDAVTHVEVLLGEEKIRAFQKAHVFLLPSNYVNEGQPVSILEAMAYGAVVITTKYRLIPTMVREGETGFFVNYGSPRDIVKCITYLMDNPDIFHQMSAKSIQLFHEYFSIDRYVSGIQELFYDIGEKAYTHK